MTITRQAFVLALSAAVLTGACAPITVHSLTGREARFETYRTYRWADEGARPTGDPRLDGNPFFEERLMSAAERGLATRGYEKSDGAGADLVLHFYANFTQTFDVADQIGTGYTTCANCATSSVYEAGTIVLDLVDARTNTLVWRSWAESSVDGAIDNPRHMEQFLDEAVGKIVATVPRRL